MSISGRWSQKQSMVVLAVLVAAACATPMEEGDEGPVENPSGGTGGDAAGTFSAGGSLDAMMGTGGAQSMGGVMSTGSGGTAMGGSGGSGKGGATMGGKAGAGAGGVTAMGGKGGSSAGMTMTTGGRAGMGSGGKGSGGATGGAGTGSGGKATGGMGSGGKATGGAGAAGRGSGGASTGGSAGSATGTPCADPRDPATPGAVSGNSGSFMTKAAVCYFVKGTFNAWNCSNPAGRMVTLNGKAATCGGALPAKLDGGIYFDFTAATENVDYTSFAWYTQ